MSTPRRARPAGEVVLEPLAPGAPLAVGDEVEVHLTLTSRVAAEYVHLRDPRPAGLEPDRSESGWRWDLGVVRYEESRDSGANFFFETLPAGATDLPLGGGKRIPRREPPGRAPSPPA